MKSILVTVRDESLLQVINEVISTVTAEMISETDPNLDQIEQIMPALIIVDYADNVAASDALFKAVTEFQTTAEIPFMFIIPETGKWNEIDGFRLGFDTKVSKERPKLGIQLRVQAILKKSRTGDDVSGKMKDFQHIMQSILKKTKTGSEDTGSFNAANSTRSLAARSKLLIVEDEALTRDVLQAALESKYEIVFAADGQKGFEAALKERPDMIISDFNMPIMDGRQFLEKIRNNQEFNTTPFLFLTARNSVEDKIEGLEQGADEYLGKPFSVRELQLRVDRLVEQSINSRRASGALQGQIAEVGLPDVLQIIGNNRKTGELILNISGITPVRLYFLDGNVINATSGKISGLKALFRILTYDEGSFFFENKAVTVKPIIKDKLENLLLEGYRQLDEFEMLRVRFPAGLSAILRPGSEKAVSSGLSTIDAIVLFAVGAHASVQEVIDKVSCSDYEALESIINLLDVGLITTD